MSEKVNFVHSFLNDLFKDPRMAQRYGEGMIASLLSESENLGYYKAEKLSVLDNDYGWFRVQNGRIAFDDDFRYGTARDASQGINRPVCARRVGNEYWVASSVRLIARFNLNWHFLGEWGTWGDFNESDDNYTEVYKFTADEENGRLYILSKTRHIVRVFDLDGRRLFDIGQAGAAGNPEDQRLNTPEDILKLPSGDILIACSGGQADGDVYPKGFVGRYTIQQNPDTNEYDAEYVDSPLSYKIDGRPENGDIERPVVLKTREDADGDCQVFVGYHESNTLYKIAVFDVSDDLDNAENIILSFSFLYDEPAPGGTSQAFSFDVDDERLYVGYSFQQPVIGASVPRISVLKLNSHEVEGGFVGEEANYNSDYRSLGFLDRISDIYVDRDEDPRKSKIIVSDFNCNHIQQFYPDQAADRPIEILYENTEERGGFFTPLDMNPDGKAQVSWKDVVDDSIPPEIWRIFP